MRGLNVCDDGTTTRVCDDLAVYLKVIFVIRIQVTSWTLSRRPMLS